MLRLPVVDRVWISVSIFKHLSLQNYPGLRKQTVLLGLPVAQVNATPVSFLVSMNKCIEKKLVVAIVAAAAVSLRLMLLTNLLASKQSLVLKFPLSSTPKTACLMIRTE